MCRPRWPHGRGRPEHHEPQWATALHTAAFLCRTEIVEALLDKGANKYLRDNFGNTAAEAVADPFDNVKDIYDSFKKALGPLGLELDYEQIRANRPQIAEILRPRTEELEAVEYAPLPGDDWNVSTPTEQGLDPMLVAELYLDATGLSTLYGLQRRFFLTSDVLIPIGLLLFIAFFVYAIVHSARKQREAKAGLFRDFASRHALRYQEEDDGKVLEFARDFDGIGRFRSPSLGKVIPKDVVHGKIEGKQVVLFRHSIHFSDSWAREWFVVGVTCKESLAQRCAVQFCKRQTHKSTMYLTDPVVKERKTGPFNLVVRAANQSGADKMFDDGVLDRLARLAADLSFRPEIQVRGNRLTVYLADRNATVDDVEALQSLLDFAESVANV